MTTPKLRYLDSFDLYILSSIFNGVNSCTYIANVTGRPKQTVSDRASKLVKIGLVIVAETDQKHFYSEYQLTDLGNKLMSKLPFDLNADYLVEIKNSI